MLILEGADGLGKTNFAQRCVDYAATKPEWPAVIYSHFTRLPPHWDYYRNYLPYITPYTVMDRFHMSEIVYGTVHRGSTKIDEQKLRLLDAQCDLVGTYTVVFVAPSDEHMRELFLKSESERPEMYQLDTVLKVNSLYETITRGYPVRSSDDRLRPRYDTTVFVSPGHYASDVLVQTVVDAWMSRLVGLMLMEKKEFRHGLI